mmetsp:Transcript_10101/g.29025  ORF Transcript_10101/g.29025 Transcript_10101/m.29025 type:complete len:325 (+) Transcript_10101:956-1930(+)
MLPPSRAEVGATPMSRPAPSIRSIVASKRVLYELTGSAPMKVPRPGRLVFTSRGQLAVSRRGVVPGLGCWLVPAETGEGVRNTSSLLAAKRLSSWCKRWQASPTWAMSRGESMDRIFRDTSLGRADRISIFWVPLRRSWATRSRRTEEQWPGRIPWRLPQSPSHMGTMWPAPACVVTAARLEPKAPSPPGRPGVVKQFGGRVGRASLRDTKPGRAMGLGIGWGLCPGICAQHVSPPELLLEVAKVGIAEGGPERKRRSVIVGCASATLECERRQLPGRSRHSPFRPAGNSSGTRSTVGRPWTNKAPPRTRASEEWGRFRRMTLG